MTDSALRNIMQRALAMRGLEPAIVFFCSWIAYFSLGFSLAGDTRATTDTFDCIFTLDSSILFKMVLEPMLSTADRTPLHPFYALTTIPFFHVFNVIFNTPKLAILAVQVTFSSLGLMCFNLMLRRLPIAAYLRVLGTVLYMFSFSMLLFTVYVESYAMAGATVALSYYVFSVRPQWLRRIIPSYAMGIVAISANVINFSHYCAQLVTLAVYSRKMREAFRLAACGGLVLAGIFLLTYLLRFAGLTPHAMTEMFALRNMEYGYMSQMHDELIMSPWEHLLFILRSFISPTAYAEIFANLFYIPLTGAPVNIQTNLTWSHSCTDFDYFTPQWLWSIVAGFMALAGIGMWHSIWNGGMLYRAAALGYAANLFFYGFVFLRASGYFYTLNFLLLYVLMILIGAEEVRRRLLPRPTLARAWTICFVSMVAVSILHSLHQFSLLNAYARTL